MVTSLFRHERIRTTKAKAQAIRRTAEKMITRAKVDSVHNRRIVAKDLQDKAVLAKLFVDIAPRFVERPGGYTRILKLRQRSGDAAEMVLLELVGEEMTKSQPKAKKKADQDAKPSRAAKKPRSEAKKTEAAPKTSKRKSTETAEPEEKVDSAAAEPAQDAAEVETPAVAQEDAEETAAPEDTDEPVEKADDGAEDSAEAAEAGADEPKKNDAE